MPDKITERLRDAVNTVNGNLLGANLAIKFRYEGQTPLMKTGTFSHSTDSVHRVSCAEGGRRIGMIFMKAVGQGYRIAKDKKLTHMDVHAFLSRSFIDADALERVISKCLDHFAGNQVQSKYDQHFHP